MPFSEYLIQFHHFGIGYGQEALDTPEVAVQFWITKQCLQTKNIVLGKGMGKRIVPGEKCLLAGWKDQLLISRTYCQPGYFWHRNGGSRAHLRSHFREDTAVDLVKWHIDQSHIRVNLIKLLAGISKDHIGYFS